ncbi:MAG: Alcohol dehydrogenase GroES domain protein, partial [Chloroflexi bacterium]|nr:Alcohol dehydrogenase GroES domain protein [Chloroflexota bacterium]
MRAVGVTEFGGPEALHIVDLPDPEAGPGQLAIVVPRGSHGAYSERVVVPAESVARVPAGATDV